MSEQLAPTIEMVEVVLSGFLPGVHVYRTSGDAKESVRYTVVRTGLARWLVAVAQDASALPQSLEGNLRIQDGLAVKVCPLNHENAEAVRQLFPWTAPRSLRKHTTTFGFGDRLGMATVGHAAAASEYAVAPVFAQQSVRELTLTGRTFQRVVDDVTFQVFQAGFRADFGADGDHLKTIPEIRRALDAGMPMVTLDLTEVLPEKAETWSESVVAERYAELPDEYRTFVEREYLDRTFELDGFSVHFGIHDLQRCAAVYHAALEFSREVDQYLMKNRGEGRYDLEISIDETSIPTLPVDHLFIALELKRLGVPLTSLAPRFIGEFQKGVDYRGELGTFEEHLVRHCAIARRFGYRISVHSGSDKFSVYPLIGKHTGLRVHVKTAGTSWLEAVRTIAESDPLLFRTMLRTALDNLDEALQYYHITPDLNAVPAPETLADDELPALLDRDSPRQVLHVAYGILLRDSQIGPAIRETLLKHEDQYAHHLIRHFRRHLDALGVPKRSGQENHGYC